MLKVIHQGAARGNAALCYHYCSDLLLGHIAMHDIMMWPIAGRSVCLLDTTVSPAKTAEPMEVPFGVGNQTGQGTVY